MAQVGSDSETAIGKGTRRKKLAGLLKSANELRQSYQQSYGLGPQRDGVTDYDDSGIPGAFPDVAIARSGDEEMLLFPSYARRRTPRKTGQQDLPGSIHDTRAHGRYNGAGYLQQEWDRYEEANSIVEVDVRGWVYSPQKGQMSRYNRAMIALARRMSGIPAPSSSRASSPNSAHHLRVEARASSHEQELVDKEAEAITRKGEGEQQVAWRGGYSESPSTKERGASSQSPAAISQAPSPRHPEGVFGGKTPNPLEKTSAYEDQDDAPGSGSLAKRASWNHPADMSSAELSVANAHMMLRLRPFLTTPLTSTPLTVFFYNSKTSRSRTIYTNEAGHFQLRAALDFIPTNVRVLASENLSATDEIHVTEPHGVSLISDVDDTIKHSAIGAGAREVFRNVFIRDLGDLCIDGVKEWYSKMASMGVKLHYVSNMPWQLFPVLASFLSGAGLPKGSFHLKHYTGMLQGIFEPVAERKKGTLERIMSDFPQRRFILVGDSGEADLELYTDIVEANPGRVLGVFIRDVTTTASQGFFDPVMNDSKAKGNTRSPLTTNSANISKMPFEEFQPRPKLPPREQTRSSSTLNASTSGPPMGKLIDYDDGTKSVKMKRSMTDNELSQPNRTSPSSTFPPRPPSKPSTLCSPSTNDSTPSTASTLSEQPTRKPAPPPPPKPRKLSSTSSPHRSNDPPNLSRMHPLPTQLPPFSSTNSNSQGQNNQYSYRSAVRSKVSSVYNSLPSFYYPPPLLSSSQNNNHNNTSLNSSNSSTRPALPSRPSSIIRPSPPTSTNTTNIPNNTSTTTSLSSYPAAAAHYATSHLSGGFGGYNHPNSNGGGTGEAGAGGVARSKKEELWLQRWARAKRILEREGVVLRSWRVGGDVSGVAGRLVEAVLREETGKGEDR
ncbi:MAG: hypothetical protein LQ343_002336 [Gyalolechia ehrenbergii]|nr:MAG: hypothetical protein LQ343_002336 [Gyalolechia ehrenbergii]